MKPSPEDVRNAWNVNRGDLPACSTLDVAGRLNRTQILCERHTLVEIVRAIKTIAASHFCNGRVPSKPDFRASYGWFVTDGTIEQALEGVFDNLEVVAPEVGQTASRDLSYWNGPKPEFTISDEEFLKAQIRGRLRPNDMDEEAARREVMELRKNGAIPSRWSKIETSF
jgi:hypothetical protein